MEDSGAGKLLVGAGAVAWTVVGVAAILPWASGRGPGAVPWWSAYAVFGVAYGYATTSKAIQVRPARSRVAALVVQSASALVLLAFARSSFEGALLCVVAGEAPLIAGEAAWLPWVVVQTGAMLAILLTTWAHAAGALLSTAVFAGFQLFAAGAARLAAREAAAARELARIHAELLATQELFADSTRTAERLRIARELHDAIGHHLTALSLQLEVARNLAEGRIKDPVDQAHGLTKTLLGELRTVVGEMREEQPIDLAKALRTLVAGVPVPRIHLQMSPELRVEAAVAHTIFRCAQEALTNAVRHAGAANVFLAIEEKGGTISVVARDDGRGAASMKAGHGLTGLRERIESIGGSVEVDARPGQGVTLRALLPSRGGAP